MGSYAPHSYAAFPTVFGLGGRNVAMGTTSLLVGEVSAYQSYSQPAVLGFAKEVQFEFGLLSVNPNVRPFGILVIDEGGQEAEFTTAGILGGRGQSLAFILPFGKKSRPLTLGFAAYLSGDSISRVSGPPVNHPFYPMYQDVARNATYTASLGYRIWNGLSLGLGMGTSLNSIADYELISKPNGVSFSATAIEVRSVFSPIFGAVYDFGWSPEGESSGPPMQIGINYRGKTELKSRVVANLEILNVPINGELTSYPHFSPAEVTLSASRKFGVGTRVSMDVSYVGWREYRLPFGTGNINSFIFGEGKEKADLNNVFVPKVGFEDVSQLGSGTFKEFSYCFGYFYYPTPIPDQTGNQNLVDNDRHGVSFGVGTAINNPWSAKTAQLNRIHFDMFFQWNHLVNRQVTKESASNLGAPGYLTGGNIYIYGLNMRIGF